MKLSWFFIVLPEFSKGFRIPGLLTLSGGKAAHCPSTAILSTIPDVVELDGDDKGSANLNFVAEISLESDSAPFATPEQILEFFDLPEAKQCAVSGGNKKNCNIIVTTSELLEKWKEKAMVANVLPPQPTDIVLEVKTNGIAFPGLTLSTIARIGCRLTEAANSYPAYEMTLIGSEENAEGLAPVVWIYKKLTGADRKNSNQNDVQSHTRVSVIPVESKSVKFVYDGCLKIMVTFPSFLLRILPTSKDKAEAQGSAAVEKRISSDVETNILELQNFYEKWHQEVLAK